MVIFYDYLRFRRKVGQFYCCRHDKVTRLRIRCACQFVFAIIEKVTKVWILALHCLIVWTQEVENNFTEKCISDSLYYLHFSSHKFSFSVKKGTRNALQIGTPRFKAAFSRANECFWFATDTIKFDTITCFLWEMLAFEKSVLFAAAFAKVWLEFEQWSNVTPWLNEAIPCCFVYAVVFEWSNVIN